MVVEKKYLYIDLNICEIWIWCVCFFFFGWICVVILGYLGIECGVMWESLYFVFSFVKLFFIRFLNILFLILVLVFLFLGGMIVYRFILLLLSVV